MSERKTKGGPDKVDVHVGQRLRVRRSLLGMSQEKLADAVGLTFQQVQKYERGINRISAGRLFQFSKILDVPIAYFYDQIGGAVNSNSQLAHGLSDNEQEGFDSSGDDLMNKKETLDLIRIYYAVKDAKKRKEILRFIKTMSEMS